MIQKNKILKKIFFRFVWMDIDDLDDFNMNNNFLSLSDIIKKDFFTKILKIQL